MTRLRRMRRLVTGHRAELVLHLEPESVTIHPKQVRRPAAAISVSWDWVYEHALWARAEQEKRERKRRAKVNRKRFSKRGR